jgi:hypothetical protein
MEPHNQTSPFSVRGKGNREESEKKKKKEEKKRKSELEDPK